MTKTNDSIQEKTDNTQNKIGPIKTVDYSTIKIDDDLKDLLPQLTEKEKKALEDSIIKEGLREPLLLWKEEVKEKSTLVDGHNRYDICKSHSIKLKVREMSFASREEVKLWILDNQAARRNMTGFKRIEAELKVKDVIAERAKLNQRQGRKNVSNPMRTDEVIGKRVGVSHVQISRAETILDLFEKGIVSEKEIEALRNGKVKINRIYNKYKKPSDASQERPSASTEASRGSHLPLARRIRTCLVSLDEFEKELLHNEDRNTLYDKIIEWANKKKDALPSQ